MTTEPTCTACDGKGQRRIFWRFYSEIVTCRECGGSGTTKVPRAAFIEGNA